MSPSTEARPIGGVHHAAFRCRDAEQTIWFYQDVLGLVADGALVLDEVTGTGKQDPYMHIFFRMKNGEYIAFFDAPGSADPDWFARKESFDMHFAFEVGSEADLLAMQERINAHGISALGPVDHGMVKSIYMYDPNGIQIELTVRTADHDRIFAEERAHLPEQLARWSARTREQKIAKFGEAALLQRGRSKPQTKEA
jgi:catechol 2,3-dioxygenase-like lactoylglutathione lyase family enzyme